MRILAAISACSMVMVVSFVGFGQVAAVKVECQGDCNWVGITDPCAALNYSETMIPYGVACDDTNTVNAWQTYSCGSATCVQNDTFPGTNSPPLGSFCDDGDGNDAVVMCTPYSLGMRVMRPVRVECNGNCDNVSMQQICGPNQVAVSTSCDDTATPGTGTDHTCGTATCRTWDTIANSDPLGAYCVDGGGADATVNCAFAGSARAAVKVECWGSACLNVTLGQVCDSVGKSTPVHVPCDDTATPGTGSRVMPCGWSSNGSSCTTYGNLVRSDSLGFYCADGGGNDAVVTCE